MYITSGGASADNIDSDVTLLMDEAKTMFSIGTYHENIVNLQGIGYEADFVNGHLLDVRTHTLKFKFKFVKCSENFNLSFINGNTYYNPAWQITMYHWQNFSFSFPSS